LVKQIRHAFELLKPEGITLLRQWIEGDEFDYRALLDFAIDKKAGVTPSERLYIKRLKQQRDVAVLLLTDLSRSTANLVPGTQSSVLDIEKEAIVLFCEALVVVGDAFAVAGFSGTGRLGADYFRIKDFDEEMSDAVKARINAMSPQRSTRMGAAIRHAAFRLEKVPAKVNLIPFNPFEQSGYERSLPQTVENFKTILINSGLITMTRKTRGDDIAAACGQLAGQVQDKSRRTLKLQSF